MAKIQENPKDVVKEPVKVVPPPVIPQELDEDPKVTFQKAWKETKSMRILTTVDGKIRGGLKPSQIKEAQELLKSYKI